MTTRQKGYYRDKCIVDIIDDFGVLTTLQLYLLFFSSIKYGVVKCRERLRILKGKGKINNIRLDINECAIHFTNKKYKNNRFISHDINRNWGFIYLLRYMNNNYKYYKFNDIEIEYVMECGKRPDGIIGFINYVTNEYKYYIIESDKFESNNKFMKVINYNEIFKNKLYLNEYWCSRVKRFPNILIVCNSENKKEKVLKSVEIDNIKYDYIDNGVKKRSGIKFIVKTVDEIKLDLGL